MSKFQLFHIYNSIQEVKIMSRRRTQVAPFSFFKKEEKIVKQLQLVLEINYKIDCGGSTHLV
jgi:hypothetical protein